MEEYDDTILVVVVCQAWGRKLVERLYQEQYLTDVWADFDATLAYVHVLWNKDAPYDDDEGLRSWIRENMPETDAIWMSTGEEFGL